MGMKLIGNICCYRRGDAKPIISAGYPLHLPIVFCNIDNTKIIKDIFPESRCELEVCSIAALFSNANSHSSEECCINAWNVPGTAAKFPQRSSSFCSGMRESTAFGTKRF